MVYNGTVTVQEGVWNTTSSGICVTINGRLINHGANCRLENAVFSDGAYIGGTQTVSFDNTLSVPTGKLIAEVPLQANGGNRDDDPILSGRFELKELRTGNVSSCCTIAAGSYVFVETVEIYSGSSWTVNGTLEPKEGVRLNGIDGTLTLGDSGVLILRPTTRFNGDGSVAGTGMVRLYGRLRGTTVYQMPQLFDATYIDDADTSDQVEDTGKETNPDNHKSIVYTKGKSWLNQRCEGCENHATATVAAADAVYKGSPVETATVTVDDNWIGAGPALTYSNNNAPGTATATITAGGASYKVEFTIYGECPGHEGTTDDCTVRPVCTLCGEAFGQALIHAFADDYACDDAKHWHTCSNNGCTARSDEAAHAFAGGSECGACGYAIFTVNLSTEGGTVTAALSVTNVSAGQRLLAAVYDENGRFLGCEQVIFGQAQENAELTVRVPQGGDLLTLFRVGEGWTAAQEAASASLK